MRETTAEKTHPPQKNRIKIKGRTRIEFKKKTTDAGMKKERRNVLTAKLAVPKQYQRR